MASTDRIDTHQHVVPPFYRDWLAARGVAAGGLPIPEWSADGAITLMDELGIATGILSVTAPGAFVGDGNDARDTARRLNEFTADVVREASDRFGFFATLTLPDVDGALGELAYAFDELGADGVVLLAHAGDRYLGDPAFDVLFDELNRRHAVVFVHPDTLPGGSIEGIPAFAADFLLDTTRAALRLAGSGTMDRCPDLQVILSHAGGFVPYAAHRVAPFAGAAFDSVSGLSVLRRFWFDLALSSSPSALPSLLAFADPERILYGSDFPYAPARVSTHFAALLDAYGLEDEQRRRINRTNAELLFPRLTRRSVSVRSR